MTAAPSGWLTEAGLTEFENDVKWEAGAIDKSILTQVAIFDRLPTVITMARSALAHQAALETATDLLKEIDQAWQAAGPGAEEAMHKALTANHEYLEALTKGNAE